MKNFESLMSEAGASYNYDVVLRRFMNNEALLEKFIRKFVDDPSYQRVLEAHANRDYKELEISAHTLKGVGANLGFDELSASSKDIVDLIRQTGYAPDADAMKKLIAALKENYEKVITAIQNLD